MKKYVTGLAAVILAISASAFTKATEKTDGEFYRKANGDFAPITPNGECQEGGEFYCKYHLKEGVEEPTNDPDDYVPEGPIGEHWQVLP